MKTKEEIKSEFLQHLQDFALTLKDYVSTADNQWVIKGFIDVFENIYTISTDTKIVSKILEIHLFSKFLEFANQNNYELVLAEHQNWYPDISFVSKEDSSIKFAVDMKTTYRSDENFCNGFTLGSHGEYFINRNSSKNIQFPYNQYLGHYCLGVIYSRNILDDLSEVEVHKITELNEIQSVISNFEFFAQEKWKIASDKSGSGNTANIGSILFIKDILQGNGVFSKLGENWFDEYWSNYGEITQINDEGKPITKTRAKRGKEVTEPVKITDIKNYLRFKGKNDDWIAQNVLLKKTSGNTKGGEDE
jgi:Restriction endonuclease EcoRV